MSTKSGIPDYRSGYNTVLETGPGKWESEENKAKYTKQAVVRKGVDAWPNLGHRALSALVEHGYLKFIISQNVDGLLKRAGVPDNRMSELHGNIFKESCVTCGNNYWRDYNIPNFGSKSHETGRKCDCGKAQPLNDTLIYFGDKLNQKEIDISSKHVQKADLCIVLGSSVQVTPAASFVRHFTIHKPADSLVIVNLQRTAAHGKGGIEIHDFCDQFLMKVLDVLHI